MSYNNKKTTVQIDWKVREALESYKVTPRETVNDVLKRVFVGGKKHFDFDVESLVGTLDVLQDPSLMRELSSALKNVSRGESVSWEEVKARNGL